MISEQQIYEKSVSFDALQKISIAAFNLMGIKVTGISASAHDTAFKYLLFSRNKLTKRQMNDIRYFIMGILSQL